jgi:hypothetical protein
MSKSGNHRRSCAICGKTFPARDVVAGAFVRDAVADEIRRDHPEWSAESFICRPDLTRYRTKYVHSILESEKGEVTLIEQEVLHSLREHEVLSTNVDAAFEREWFFGERLADRIASFGGSWTFLIWFGVFLALWVVMNSIVLMQRPVDPYPFILLNLVLSCLAAIQARTSGSAWSRSRRFNSNCFQSSAGGDSKRNVPDLPGAYVRGAGRNLNFYEVGC